MTAWETELTTRDTNRVVRPFEWGAEWLNAIGHPSIPAELNGDGPSRLSEFAAQALRESGRFYDYLPVRDYRLQDSRLNFTSPVRSGDAKNDTVHALWFPAEKGPKRALVVLPQWNSGPDGHVGLAKLLNRFGISALRMTMAYHAERMPAAVPIGFRRPVPQQPRTR